MDFLAGVRRLRVWETLGCSPHSAWPWPQSGSAYLGLVVYLNKYDNILNPYVVYVAVVCGLFVRFEFMNERVVFFTRFVEVASLVHICVRLISTLLKAY
jgi:hypothetical protein